ncbi:Fc receptor-like protein 6 isoform X2 [Rhinolophus sinicus]|uniref:Fc receptor-like protein 6 isoform X2 n=1 Tax=Rhinolophus sinicus TaxID=89399 RepID=UPI003D7B589E
MVLWPRCSPPTLPLVTFNLTCSVLRAKPGPMLLWKAVLLFDPCVGKTVWLLLQAWPDPVFEGDILTLWCHRKKNVNLSYVKCYKDGKVLHFSKDNQPLFTGTAAMRSGGQYSCTGEVMYFPQMDRQASGMAMIQVQGGPHLAEQGPPPRAVHLSSQRETLGFTGAR